MRAALGIVSLLVVLAIVGLVSTRQLRAVGHVDPSAMTAAGVVAPLPVPPNATPQQQANQIEQKVLNDVNKALSQGAARPDESERP